jgi:predicted acyl esterase
MSARAAALALRDGHQHPTPVEPGKVYDVPVHVWPTHYRLAAGHRLEVTIASDDHPEISSDAPAGHVTISGGTVTPATMS